MRRREFITLIGSAATWPLVAGAQQPARPVFGILLVFSEEAGRTFTEPLRAYMQAQQWPFDEVLQKPATWKVATSRLMFAMPTAR